MRERESERKRDRESRTNTRNAKRKTNMNIKMSTSNNEITITNASLCLPCHRLTTLEDSYADWPQLSLSPRFAYVYVCMYIFDMGV